MKLIAKERIGSKTIKRHDSPKTPYQRVIASPHISESIKRSLTKELETLNPFVLRETMEAKLKKSSLLSTLGKIYYESMLPILTIASVRFNYEATGI